MSDRLIRRSAHALAAGLLVALAGCAAPPAAPPTPTGQCQAARSGDPLVGNWLAIHKQKGVSGQLHILVDLTASGSMTYTEQLRRGSKPPQGLHETGCWQRDKDTLVLKTTKSNGEPVELSDPIYTNRYQILAESGSALSLQGPDASITARRMPAGYRLPY